MSYTARRNVVALPIKRDNTADMGKAQKRSGSAAVDRVFFLKEDISLGTELQFWGRSDAGVIYKVTRIRSWYSGKKFGNWVLKNVNTVRHTTDEIEMVSSDGGTKQGTFSYISYSGIWWLA